MNDTVNVMQEPITGFCYWIHQIYAILQQSSCVTVLSATVLWGLLLSLFQVQLQFNVKDNFTMRVYNLSSGLYDWVDLRQERSYWVIVVIVAVG